MYALLKSGNQSLVNTISAEEKARANAHPQSSWISRVLPGEETRLEQPRLMRNFFKIGKYSAEALHAYHINNSANIRSITVHDATAKFGLVDFPYALEVFFRQIVDCNPGINLTFSHIRIWFKFKIQIYSSHQTSIIMPAQTVQAYSPEPPQPHSNPLPSDPEEEEEEEATKQEIINWSLRTCNTVILDHQDYNGLFTGSASLYSA